MRMGNTVVVRSAGFQFRRTAAHAFRRTAHDGCGRELSVRAPIEGVRLSQRYQETISGQVGIPSTWFGEMLLAAKGLQARCPHMALFGPGAMSDLSPSCVPKRTSANAFGLRVHALAHALPR